MSLSAPVNAVFSEHEFATSPVRLSVTLVHPTQPVEIFGNVFWYLGHPLTSTEIFAEIVPGEPLRWGFKCKMGSEI